LFDTLTGLGSQMTSIQSAVDGIGDRTTANESSILVLQSPPNGVPVPLLNWLAVPHAITEVDVTLNSRLNTDETTVSGHTASINANATNIAQEITDRTTAVTTVQSEIDELEADITELTTSLNAEISNRATSDS